MEIKRKSLTLIASSVEVPSQGSSDVPVKFVNDTETYVGFIIEPRIGYYVNGCLKYGICEYDISNNTFKIPAEAFKNKGILVISIALIDSEDPNHIEVTKELSLEVTPAPNGTIIFPSEDTWQTIVLNLINQFFVTSNEIKNQIKYAVDNAIEDGSIANMTIEDDSITSDKLADDIISPKNIKGLYVEKVLYKLTDLNSLIKGSFVENIPTPSEDGDKYFTDYIKVEDYNRLTVFKNTQSSPYIRFYNADKEFVRGQYVSSTTVISSLIQESEVYVVLEGNSISYGETYRVAYQSEYEYESLNILSNSEKTYYIQETTIESAHDSSYSELIPVIKGETYTYKGNAGAVIFYDALGNSFGDNNGDTKLDINDGETFTIPLDDDITYLKFVCWNNNIGYLTGKFFVEKLSNSDLKLTEDNFDSNIIASLRQMLNIGAGSNQFYNVLDFGVTTLADDNTQAFQNAIDTIAENGGGILWVPKGTYKFDKSSSTSGYGGNAQNNVYLKNNVSIIGESLKGTVLKLIGDTQTGCSLFGSFNGNDNSLTGATYSNFTVDLSELTMATYTHKAKAFYVHGIKDCVFRDLRLISTPSTSLGIDMLDNVVMDSIYVYQGGKNWTNGGNGGAGIGIGTGLWENENYIIRNCICDDCGHFGIFLEDQGIFSSGKDRNYPKGQIISNNIVRNGRNYGIGVRGGKNVVITGNNVYENVGGIYVDYGAKNVLISNNLIEGSTDAGFNYGNEDSTVNGASYKCENIAVISNAFIENNIGIKHSTEPTNRNELNNIFINNTKDNDD